jgi:hypothetical protein
MTTTIRIEANHGDKPWAARILGTDSHKGWEREFLPVTGNLAHVSQAGVIERTCRHKKSTGRQFVWVSADFVEVDIPETMILDLIDDGRTFAEVVVEALRGDAASAELARRVDGVMLRDAFVAVLGDRITVGSYTGRGNRAFGQALDGVPMSRDGIMDAAPLAGYVPDDAKADAKSAAVAEIRRLMAAHEISLADIS